MRFEVKKRIVGAALIAMVIWPLVHHGLVRVLDLNPWNWFGWSMYTVPPKVFNGFAESLDGKKLRGENLSERQAKRLAYDYYQFTRLRKEYGEGVAPDIFARALFRAFPDVQGVKIFIQTCRLDRSSAMFVQTSLSDPPYEYHRQQFGD